MATEQTEEPQPSDVRLHHGVVEVFDGNEWLPYEDEDERFRFEAIFRDGEK